MKVCLSCGYRFATEDWRCPSCNKSPEVVNGFLSFAPDLSAANDGFGEGYFEQLFKVEDGNFWFRSRNKLLIWALGKYFPQAKSVFEIGCGTGYVLSGIEKAFPYLALCGSEIFSTGLTYAAKRLKKAKLFQMDACQIPFENEFDVIGAFDVLEHIKDDEAVLKQMHQACKHKGGIILTVPQHAFLWSYMDEYSCHVRRYCARELKMKVERAGFKVLRMTSFVSILLPLMIISRLKNKQSDQFDPTSELRISGLLNYILERVLDLERSMIRLGLSFPAGGSLLLIARKNSGFVS